MQRAATPTSSLLPQIPVIDHPDEPDANVVRVGDVEKFYVYLAYQNVLQAQVRGLKAICPDLPDFFPGVVRNIWCRYVTAARLDYSEERFDDDTTIDVDTSAIVDRAPVENLKNIDTTNPFDDDPRLPLTLIILYAGCLHCHIPVMLSELRIWAMEGKLPYLNSIQCVPQEAKEGLGRGGRSRFTQNTKVPEYDDLYKMACRVNGFLAFNQHIPLPKIDALTIVMKALQAYVMPLSLYPLCMKIAEVYIEKRTGYAVMKRGNLNAIHYLEAAVFSSVLFLCKLLYGLFVEDCTVDRYNSYFRTLTDKHNLPDYSNLMVEWERRVFTIRSEWTRNASEILRWSDLDVYLTGTYRDADAGPSQLKEFLDEYPDLADTLRSYNSPFINLNLCEVEQDLYTITTRNPNADLKTRKLWTVPSFMMKRFLLYGTDTNKIHRPFLYGLWLGAGTLGISVDLYYEVYYRLFVI